MFRLRDLLCLALADAVRKLRAQRVPAKARWSREIAHVRAVAPFGERTGGSHRPKRGIEPRGRRGASRSDRDGQSETQRRRQGSGGGGAQGRRRGGSQGRLQRHAWTSARRSLHHQGEHRSGRRGDHVGIAGVRSGRGSPRCASRREAARGRGSADRADQSARHGTSRSHAQFPTRRHAQSLECGTDRRRFERRRSGGSGLRHVASRPWQRPRRLAAQSRQCLRHRIDPAFPRPRARRGRHSGGRSPVGRTDDAGERADGEDRRRRAARARGALGRAPTRSLVARSSRGAAARGGRASGRDGRRASRRVDGLACSGNRPASGACVARGWVCRRRGRAAALRRRRLDLDARLSSPTFARWPINCCRSWARMARSSFRQSDRLCRISMRPASRACSLPETA